MNVNCNTNNCSFLVNSKCVYYESLALPYTGIGTNDSIQLALQKIEDTIAVIISQGGGGIVESIEAGVGISVTGTSTVPIITNTSPDQTVVLTEGTGISVTGTYPNFTITNTSPSDPDDFWKTDGITNIIGETTINSGFPVNFNFSDFLLETNFSWIVPTSGAFYFGSLLNNSIVFDNTGLTFSVVEVGDVFKLNIGSDSIGDIYQRNGSGNFSRLAAVSDGSFLRSNGVGTVNSWSTLKIPNTIAALSTFVANSANTLVAITPAAGQSIRINAGGTAWEAYTPGTGSGDMVLADVQTSTGKKTFQASGTSAGINVSSVAAHPSGLTNGDLWYQSTDHLLSTRINGTTYKILVTTNLVTDGVAYSSGNGIISLTNSLQFDSAVSNHKMLSYSSVTSAGLNFVPQAADPSSLTDGDIWYNNVDNALKARINGITISLGSGGITNSAAANELMKSDGTNAVASTIFSTADGRLYGTALHNNAGAVTGTTNQYIASGTYTPTLTSVANIASSSAVQCQWIRVGNVVHVSGWFNVTATAAAPTSTVIAASLPIASNLAASENLAGVGAFNTSSGVTQYATIGADTVNDRATVSYEANSAAGTTCIFTFTYLIL